MGLLLLGSHASPRARADIIKAGALPIAPRREIKGMGVTPLPFCAVVRPAAYGGGRLIVPGILHCAGKNHTRARSTLFFRTGPGWVTANAKQ